MLKKRKIKKCTNNFQLSGHVEICNAAQTTATATATAASTATATSIADVECLYVLLLLLLLRLLWMNNKCTLRETHQHLLNFQTKLANLQNTKNIEQQPKRKENGRNK